MCRLVVARIAITGILLAVSVSAAALAVEQLGEIRVIAPAQPLITRNLPGESVRVLTRKDWEGRGLTLAEALEEAAGVIITRTGGAGSLTTVGLRGARGNQVLVMLNGVPVSLPGGLALDLSLLGLEGVERIEIIRAGASFGSRAEGGVINIITRGQQALKASSGLQLSRGSFGTWNASWQRARTSSASQDFLLLSGFGSEGDFDFASVNGPIRTRQNNRARRVNVLWESQSFNANTLTSSFLNLGALRRGVPGFAEFPTLRAKLTEALGTAGWSRFSEPADECGWSRELQLSLSGSHLRFHDPEPTIGAPISSKATELTARTEVVLRRKAETSQNPDTQLGVALTEQALHGSDYGSRQQARGAVSLVRSFAIGSLRASAAGNATASEGQGVNGSWELALRQGLGRETALSASFGRSFRFPDMSELYFPNEGYIRGNPDLHSESARFADIGIEMERPSFRFALHAFRRQQEDTIKFVPVSAYAIEPRNLPSAIVKGLEAEGGFSIGKHLSGNASYTLTRASFRKSGLPFTQMPRYKLSTMLRYRDGGFSFSAAHTRESAQTSDLFGSIRVPAKRRTDLSASWRGKRNEWILTVQNLFDQGGRDFWDLPLPGRYIEITMKHSL